MKLLSYLFVLAFLFVLGACSQVENSTPVSPQDEITLSKVPVPFKVKIEGLLDIFPSGLTTGTGRIEGSGTGTHTGLYTSVSTNDYELTSPTSGVFTNGLHTVITTNGDEMYASYTGSWIVNTEGLYEYTMNMEFTGGTGRFEDITGEVTTFVIGENISQLQKTITGQGNGWILFE